MRIKEILSLILFCIALIMLIKLFQFVNRFVKSRFQPSNKFEKTLWKISFAFVLLTPFIIPIKVAKKGEFLKLSFGFPFAYVEQYTHNAFANLEYPFLTTLINPWGHSLVGNLNIRVDLFIISMVSVYAIIYLLVFALKELKLIKVNSNLE